MLTQITEKLDQHIDFSYSCFDRVVLRGYLPNIFVEGSVINLLRNLGFKNHSNGVFKLLTDQLNSHINKQATKMDIPLHWWGKDESKNYNSKLEFVNQTYSKQVSEKQKTDCVICIIKALENTNTFA